MNALSARRRNLVGASAFAILAVVVLTQMAGLEESSAGSDPGAAGYPSLIAGVMLVLAVLLALQTDHAVEPVPRRDLLRVGATVLVLVAYVALLEPLGYVLATIALLVATLALMGVRSIVALVVAPVGVALANFYLFYTAFGVPLPFSFVERMLS